MAEKDATARLRRAIKENNLFLVKRLIQRTDMRNPDPSQRRYTSLAWAAVLGHEETFEFLLTAGHDDEELSRDSDSNTILMLLADFKPPPLNPYAPGPSEADLMSAALRMARLYYERYPWILDWSNVHGKTALHMTALKGSEELVRMLCDLGADYDLSDNKGNTPLHYASSWGHIPVVQLLIERGCQFAARNNEGFTASDYAYSFSTKDTLQDSARSQFENNKKSRRLVFAQAAARGNEWGKASAMHMPPPLLLKARNMEDTAVRMRSGSGGSRTTATSDSGDLDSVGVGLANSISSLSASSSSISRLGLSNSTQTPGRAENMTGTFSVPPPATAASTSTAASGSGISLSPIVNRMRERDADAMEKYMRRNRSGSAGTTSTDNTSQVSNGFNFASAGPSSNGDDITALTSIAITGSTTPRRRLRPSFSAAQLRSTPPPAIVTADVLHSEASRHRSGTNPQSRPAQPTLSPTSIVMRTSSFDSSRYEESLVEEPQTSKFISPPSQYARFLGPSQKTGNPVSTVTSSIGRRLPFNILSKPTPSTDPPPGSHRRGSSATSIR